MLNDVLLGKDIISAVDFEVFRNASLAGLWPCIAFTTKSLGPFIIQKAKKFSVTMS